MNAYTRVPVFCLGLITLMAVHAMPALAQAERPAPVFLAMPQSFPELDARAVLMRTPGRDIVILNEADAGPETLAVALGVLARMRREHPRAGDRGQLVPITGFVYRREMKPARRAALEATLAELNDRPLANVGNLGRGRWMRYRNR